MTDIFCPMIHGGLNIDLKSSNNKLSYNQCCLSTNQLSVPDDARVDWNSSQLQDIRKQNNNNIWHPGCWECERLEKVGIKSFRHSMIEKLGVKKNLSGPQRIDLLFDRSCNLACITCGPNSSTLWQKHLKDNNLIIKDINNVVLPVDYANDDYNFNKVHQILRSIDLSNVEMIQFCGGETLLGNTYWKTAELLAELVPNAKNKLELGFQTNGTQPIDPKYYDLIDKFKLVKLMVSIDGVGDKFEYLRWPASWNQVTDNVLNLRDTLPDNVMFFVQETTSFLNLYYFDEVSTWVKNNFRNNRSGDPIDHSTQLAIHDYLDVNNITQEYVDALAGTRMIHALASDWKEKPSVIKTIIAEVDRFDKIRKLNWKNTFPEVAEFYRRYL
jgi:sulfatase maturation enzyme AslB (radical SAM superfamily)